MGNHNITYSGLSHKGMVRSHNEDYYHIEQEYKSGGDDQKVLVTLLIVADGMGGARAGELASSVAVNSVVNDFTNFNSFVDEDEVSSFLSNSFEVAHNQIANLAMKDSDIAGMGTTMTLALVIDDTAYITWIGDSRAYVFNSLDKKNNKYTNQRGFKLITKDHSMIWSQIEKGNVSLDDAESVENSHIITQSLGSFQHKPNPDFNKVVLKEGDILLLCTDGINRHLDSSKLADFCKKIQEQPTLLTEVMEDMEQAVLDQGAEDNFTLILASYGNAEGMPSIVNQDVKKSLWNSRRELIYGSLLAIMLIAGFNYFFGIGSDPNSDEVKSEISNINNTSREDVKNEIAALQSKKDSLHTGLLVSFDAMYDTIENQYKAFHSLGESAVDSLRLLADSHLTFLGEKEDRRDILLNQDELGIRIYQDTETQFKKLQASYINWMTKQSLDENE